ncbi:elongation factor P maturation arginine rhamnosyltransferase EarP, partial [Acinetobacter baumannii]
LPSQHPRTGLIQRFWFPGFTPGSGGLLREAGLLAARDAFQRDAAAQAAFWQHLALPQAPDHDRRVSLFAYENPAIAGLLTTLADDRTSTLLLVPAGRALADVER